MVFPAFFAALREICEVLKFGLTGVQMLWLPAPETGRQPFLQPDGLPVASGAQPHAMGKGETSLNAPRLSRYTM